MSRRVIRSLLPALLVSLAVPTSPAPAGARPAGDCPPGWSQAAIPTPSGTYLQGVVTIAEDDAWAVGYLGHPYATFTEHWDGSAWAAVPSPNGTPHRNVLNAVSASESDDVWAVGYQTINLEHGERALIEHWNGSAWSIVPAHGEDFSTLFGVVALAPDDAWAVGSAGFTAQHTLIEHWDGSTWSVVPSLSPGDGDNLFAVDGTSGSDVWAVGDTYNSNPHRGARGMILHWDGAVWTWDGVRRGPDHDTFFLDVTAVGPADVWAAGDIFGPPLGYAPILQHWDGSRWSRVAGPVTGRSIRTFGIDAVATDDVWAVGGLSSGSGGISLMHWDGARWTRQLSRLHGGGRNLQAVSLLPNGDGWAVGTQGAPNDAHGIGGRACGI